MKTRTVLLTLMFVVVLSVFGQAGRQAITSSAYATLTAKDYNEKLTRKDTWHPVDLPVVTAFKGVSVDNGVITVLAGGDYQVSMDYDRQTYNNHLLKFRVSVSYEDGYTQILGITPGIYSIDKGGRVRLEVKGSSNNCYPKLTYVSLSIVKL